MTKDRTLRSLEEAIEIVKRLPRRRKKPTPQTPKKPLMGAKKKELVDA